MSTPYENWTPVNARWAVRIERKAFRIFPRDKNGKVRPVLICRNIVYLKSEINGDCTLFTHYLHRGEWRWKSEMGDTDETSARNTLIRMLGEIPAKEIMAAS